MDERIFKSKHIDIWLDTFEIGIGVNFARQLKTFYIHLLLLDIAINWSKED